MRTDEFDFDLPDERIALRPAEPRDSARLLEVHPDALTDRTVSDLPNLLSRGDIVVFNDTRVIPAALTGIRTRGEIEARIQVNLHKRLDGNRWMAFARPARKLLETDRIAFGTTPTNTNCLAGRLDATVASKGEQGEIELSFDLAGAALDDALAQFGTMPLPPYIASRRAADADDAAAYQTTYAREDGAVAAPTAGLHFTDGLLANLNQQGIATEFLTLHVGAGTFLPVKTDDIENHAMHAEWGRIDAETAARLNEARASGGRLIAVGTTVTRLLETAVDDHGKIQPFAGDTSIFIKPGYEFGAIDAMWTNFHLPRSTLFMLVAAFAGLDRMQTAYAHAVNSGYRFYSYGDASLLWPSHD